MKAIRKIKIGFFLLSLRLFFFPRKLKLDVNTAFLFLTRSDAPGGLKPSLLNPQYRRSTHAVPAAVPNCTDCHELETLMPPGAQDPVLPLTEPNEQQSLMSSAGEAYDAPTELKVRCQLKYV